MRAFQIGVGVETARGNVETERSSILAPALSIIQNKEKIYNHNQMRVQ